MKRIMLNLMAGGLIVLIASQLIGAFISSRAFASLMSLATSVVWLYLVHIIGKYAIYYTRKSIPNSAMREQRTQEPDI